MRSETFAFLLYLGRAEQQLTKLQALKVLVFSRFPIESATEKEKVWKSIKKKINSKCHLSKYVHKLARSS